MLAKLFAYTVNVKAQDLHFHLNNINWHAQYNISRAQFLCNLRMRELRSIGSYQ